MEKEVALNGYIYVDVAQGEESEEEIVTAARGKVEKILEEHGISYQFFSEELRDL